MESIIHADIFFLITSIAVVIFTICIIVIAFFVIRILNDIKHISKTVQEESSKLVGDIEKLRATAMSQGDRLKWLTGFIPGLFGRKTKTRAKHTIITE